MVPHASGNGLGDIRILPKDVHRGEWHWRANGESRQFPQAPMCEPCFPCLPKVAFLHDSLICLPMSQFASFPKGQTQLLLSVGLVLEHDLCGWRCDVYARLQPRRPMQSMGVPSSLDLSIWALESLPDLGTVQHVRKERERGWGGGRKKGEKEGGREGKEKEKRKRRKEGKEENSRSRGKGESYYGSGTSCPQPQLPHLCNRRLDNVNFSKSN